MSLIVILTDIYDLVYLSQSFKTIQMVKNIKMTEKFQPADEFRINDVETLKVIADATRMQILQTLGEPKTVKEIAAILDMPATKLYYHVNLMEKHGMIVVVATNIVSGIIEKTYQAAAKSYKITDELMPAAQLSSSEIEPFIQTIFDATASETLQSAQAGLIDLTDEDDRSHLISRIVTQVTASQFDDFLDRLEAWKDEIKSVTPTPTEDDPVKTVGVTLAFYPIRHPIKHKEQPTDDARD